MRVYYNEHDPYAAAWLRNLIAAGAIPAGDVDERDIRSVVALDHLGRYDQCHWFAGIGGWPLALALAGWGDRPVWTGSCPCQPYSAAGLRLGTVDPRHLWPQLHRLISICQPPVVFGEQVAGAAGRGWLAGVRADLVELGYRFGAADLPAAGAGAPHIRQRLWWVADASDGYGWTGVGGAEAGAGADGERRRRPPGRGDAGGLADDDEGGREEQPPGRLHVQGPRRDDAVGRGEHGGLGVALGEGLERHAGDGDDRDQPGWLEPVAGRSAPPAGGAGFWDAYDLVHCSDGKARRIEPGAEPLAHGVSARVGKLRAYGNAVVPQVAAAFVAAYLDTLT